MTRMADSLRTAIERSVLDSVARFRGIPPGVFGKRFVVVESLGRERRDMVRPGPGDVPAYVPRVYSDRSGRSDALSPEAFAERLANMGPPRRLFISYPSPSRSRAFAASASDSLVDSLRRTLSRNKRYVLIDADSARDVLSKTRNLNEISKTLNVDLFASIFVSPLPDSSVIWTLQLRDLSAHSAYGVRAVTSKSGPTSLLAGTDSLVARAVRYLQEIDRAPRRQGLRDSGT